MSLVSHFVRLCVCLQTWIMALSSHAQSCSVKLCQALSCSDAEWCWIMLNDAEWCWMMLNDAEWCWMMLYDAVWCWMMIANKAGVSWPVGLILNNMHENSTSITKMHKNFSILHLLAHIVKLRSRSGPGPNVSPNCLLLAALSSCIGASPSCFRLFLLDLIFQTHFWKLQSKGKFSRP